MIIAHRINRIVQLEKIPADMGIEVDLREDGRHLILQHDSRRSGERFDSFLRRFRHRMLVVNPKCDGLEEEALSLLARHRVREFFFVDLTLPAIARLKRRGECRIAARLSEIEPVEGCLALAGIAEWLWIDCFTRYPSMGPHRDRLLRRFKTCLVAPELHGRPPASNIEALRLARRYGASAVCTDRPDRWKAIWTE